MRARKPAMAKAKSMMPSAAVRSCGDSQVLTAPVSAGKLRPSEIHSIARAASRTAKPLASAVDPIDRLHRTAATVRTTRAP